MPKSMSNSIIFDDNQGNLLQNGVIQTNQLTSKGDVILGGAIVNGSNVIAFNEQYQFTDIYSNAHIYGTLFLDFGGTVYNVGDVISQGTSGTYASYPSITYDAPTNTTTFTGAMVFPATSIESTSIINTRFVSLTTNQTISGSKTFNVSQIFTSDLRLDGSLVLNTNTLSIPNSTLQKLQYISTISSDIQTQTTNNATNITTLETKTTNMSFADSTTTFTGTMVFGTQTISPNAIVGIACTLSQAQNITGVKTFTQTQIFNQNIRLDGGLILNADGVVTVSNAELKTLDGVTSALQPQLTDLQTKTANQSSSGSNTTFSNNTIFDNIIFNTTINTIDPTTFGYLSGVNNPIQNQINSATNQANDAYTLASSADDKADSALVLATTANGVAGGALTASAGAVTTAGIALSASSTANSRCGALEGRVDEHDGDIGALQVKTTRISYNSATSKTTITNTLQATSFQFTSLTSGFNQTATNDITIRGQTEIKNTLSITDGYGLNVDGGISQLNNSANAFNGTITANNNFTASGAQTSLNSTNTQIGVSSLETLTVNSLATFNNDITLVANKKLTLKNIVPHGLDDLYFGGETGAYQNYNCYFDMKSTFYQKVTIIDEVAIGTLAFRAPLTSYNDTVLIDASTSLELESSVIATLSAPIVNIGLVLGVNNLRGTTFIQNLATTSGVINAIGTVVRQF